MPFSPAPILNRGEHHVPERSVGFSSWILQIGGCPGSGCGLPLWYVEECLSQQRAAGKDGLRFGLIGCGGQGRGDAGNASHFGKVVAVCDVDASHVASRQGTVSRRPRLSDFRKLLERKDIDVVVCGTVDHWHTLVAIAAMKAGKDIYCEKPLTLTMDEGKHLVKVQEQTGRVLQTGTQQRSDVYFRLACDLVRNGRIGKLEKVEVWFPAGLRQGPFATAPVPNGFNFDFWRARRPRSPMSRSGRTFSFRYWWEYSGGTMTDWGAHHNDIALWAIDPPEGGPVSVEGKQLEAMIPGGFTAASEYEVRYTYANGVVHDCRSTTGSEWHGGVKDSKKAAARHQVHRQQGLDLGHTGRDQRQRPQLPGRRSCPPGPSGSTRVTITWATSWRA